MFHLFVGNPPRERIFTKFCTSGDMPDIIICANFYVEKLRSLGHTGSQALEFFIEMAGHPFNNAELPHSLWCDVTRVTFWEAVIASRVCRYFVIHFCIDSYAGQYEFVVVNGQTTTSTFHKVVYDSNEVRRAKLSHLRQFFGVSCQKLLKLVSILLSYLKHKSCLIFKV